MLTLRGVVQLIGLLIKHISWTLTNNYDIGHKPYRPQWKSISATDNRTMLTWLSSLYCFSLQRLCSRLTALWRYINFVLLLLLLLLLF